jgi:GMC oxidoreductase
MAGDPAYPPGRAPPLPPLPIGKIGRKAAEGMNRLGWHWWPAAHAIPSQARENQAQCARRGTCMFGCPEGAKGSTDLTLWPAALQAGAKLVTGARVREITRNARGLATGAVWVDRDGAEQRAEADVVVLAANGIGTPRLLLLSELANSSGLVGKRLMLHPYMVCSGSTKTSWRAGRGRGERPCSRCSSRTRTSRAASRAEPNGTSCRSAGPSWRSPATTAGRSTSAADRPSIAGCAEPSAGRSTGESGSRTSPWRRTASSSIPPSPTRTASRRRRCDTGSTTRLGGTWPGSSSGRRRPTRPPAPSRRSSRTGRSGAGTSSAPAGWVTTRHVGGRPLGPGPRRPEPLRRGRERLRHVRPAAADGDDRGERRPLRGAPDRDRGRPADARVSER